MNSSVRLFIWWLSASGVVSSLQYNFGDGSYYVGSVDTQGRPTGLGQYYNATGHLGELCNVIYRKNKQGLGGTTAKPNRTYVVILVGRNEYVLKYPWAEFMQK